MGHVFNFTGLISDILRAYREVYIYFFTGLFRIDNPFMVFIYGFIFLMFLFSLILAIYKTRTVSVLNIVVIFTFVLLLPLAANFSRVFDTGNFDVITRTSFSFIFFLILPLIFLGNFEIKTYGLKNLLAVVLVLLIGYNIALSNYIYFRAQVFTEHAMLYANRITTRIEPLLPYSTNNEVLFHGNLVENPIYPDMDELLFREYVPPLLFNRINLGGCSSSYDFFLHVIRYRVGLNITSLGFDLERRNHLINEAISMGMPVYPQEGSVKLIDGVVVSMQGFFGRIDIDETTPNSFTATANHTGKASDLEFEYIWYLYKNNQRVKQINPDNADLSQVSYDIYDPGIYSFKVSVYISESELLVLNIHSSGFEVK